jgi:alpha-tubulin suppressor-like RCC1 family protein
MALSADTTKWFGTGCNADGQLGLGNLVDKNTFTQLTGNWSQVICGGSHNMALSADTTKWFATGNNFNGQLGIGNPLVVGYRFNTFTALTGNWSQVICCSSLTMAFSGTL